MCNVSIQVPSATCDACSHSMGANGCSGSGSSARSDWLRAGDRSGFGSQHACWLVARRWLFRLANHYRALTAGMLLRIRFQDGLCAVCYMLIGAATPPFYYHILIGAAPSPIYCSILIGAAPSPFYYYVLFGVAPSLFCYHILIGDTIIY